MFNKELVGNIYHQARIFVPVWLGLINHMLGVSHVAGLIARQLVAAGVEVDVELVETAAAVHDIGKVINSSERGHVLAGVKFLRAKRIDERIVLAVERHQVWSFGEDEISGPQTWEEKLVFLADMSFGDRIIPMRARREDILSHYPHIRKEWLRETTEMIYREILEIISPQTLPI